MLRLLVISEQYFSYKGYTVPSDMKLFPMNDEQVKIWKTLIIHYVWKIKKNQETPQS
jgi:hypothetical protein